jgi:hypothetical protein
MDAQGEVDQQRIVTIGPPPRRPSIRPKWVILSLLVVILAASPFMLVLAGLPFGTDDLNAGQHAKLMANDLIVWDQAIAYTPESVMHTTEVWNITGSGDRTFTMHTYAMDRDGSVSYDNDSREHSYWPHIGYAFSDSNDNNATPTIEMIQTAFGEKRAYHYHCPERSLGDGGSIPPSDTYIGVDTNVVYLSHSFSPGADITFTLKDTNAQSILNGDGL